MNKDRGIQLKNYVYSSYVRIINYVDLNTLILFSPITQLILQVQL